MNVLMTTEAAQRFARAAANYERAAQVQREVAVRFDAWLGECGAGAADIPRRIAEIGCGTGFLAHCLRARFPQASLHCTDLAAEMLEQCRLALHADHNAGGEGISFAVCDGRTAVFSPRPDWIVSSMCFQWFDDLDAALRHHLGQCKMLAFSLLLDGSFGRWRAAHHAANVEPGLRSLPSHESMQELIDTLRAAGCVSRVRMHRLCIDEQHADGLSFARALRAIGADAPHPAHRPANLWPVLRQLEEGFTANYEIGFYRIEA